MFPFISPSLFFLVSLGVFVGLPNAAAQDGPNETAAKSEPSQQGSKLVTFTTQDDHREMRNQLGITQLRPGPSGNPNDAHAANIDESKANPYPDLPAILVLKNGEKVTTLEMWWTQRRSEIVEDFEQEVLGRIPENVPAVTWEIVGTVEKTLGETVIVEKQLTGKVDNSQCPEIDITISMVVVTPKEVVGKVPVLMMFGSTGFEPGAEEFRRRFAGRNFGPRPGTEPPATQQLVEQGWGYATISPSTIQADNGAGLTRGIIGLTNQGQPRKPDDWGALRAWAWGASRGLDYLETDPSVDAKRVGIEGVSRYGKAALVTMAFDQRFAMVLVGSSGEGGASLYRRNFGEAVESLTSSGEYHWMAGNFLKYGTAESSFGAKQANDLPVDSHQLIALCAPRLTFISYGIPEKGDALWLDQHGSFMATIAAQPVFRLLGARDLGRSDDYNTEKMPAVNAGLLNGELAWRQHDGGHTDLPNIKHFVTWANARFAKHERTPKDGAATSQSRHEALKRKDPNSLAAHEQLLAKSKQGTIDVFFVGDSITRRWGATDYPKLLVNWDQNFRGWNAANFGWGGDTTHNILWRLQNGEFDGVRPKIVVLQAGTNNLPWTGSADEQTIQDVFQGIKTIIDHSHTKTPDATIIVTGVFPRSQNAALAPAITAISDKLANLADGKRIRYLTINEKLTNSEGALLPSMSDDGVHLTEPAYQIWADGLKPIFTEILGPRDTVDRAPPPTGDPRVTKQ